MDAAIWEAFTAFHVCVKCVHMTETSFGFHFGEELYEPFTMFWTALSGSMIVVQNVNGKWSKSLPKDSHYILRNSRWA